MSILLSEYWEAAGGPARLHTLLRLTSADHAALLVQRLAALPGAMVEQHHHEEGCLLSLWLAAGDQVDQALQQIEALTELFNQEYSGEVGAELLETRLVSAQPQAQSSNLFRLSERFHVACGSELPPPSQDVGTGETIILAPGLAFGSGRHPSTRLAAFALEEWAAGQPRLARCRVLDIGTGSGVLAILCGRLGAGRVLGIDICPQALAAAARNIQANGLSGRVAVGATPLAQISERFDLIVANLTPAVLAGLLDYIPPRLAASGTLIISGQMGRRAGELKEILAGRGFAKAVMYREGKWQALRLRTGYFYSSDALSHMMTF